MLVLVKLDIEDDELCVRIENSLRVAPISLNFWSFSIERKRQICSGIKKKREVKHRIQLAADFSILNETLAKVIYLFIYGPICKNGVSEHIVISVENCNARDKKNEKNEKKKKKNKIDWNRTENTVQVLRETLKNVRVNEIWNERINKIYTVSYLYYELKILIKMLKFFYETTRTHRILILINFCI